MLTVKSKDGMRSWKRLCSSIIVVASLAGLQHCGGDDSGVSATGGGIGSAAGAAGAAGVAGFGGTAETDGAADSGTDVSIDSDGSIDSDEPPVDGRSETLESALAEATT